MQQRAPADQELKVLPEHDATRLLERASELDVARIAGSSVADLRAAAAEAGISAHSFDAALAEMQRDANPTVLAHQARPRGRFWKWAFAALAMTVFVAMLVVARTVVVPVPSMVEETILLRCLTPGEAGELIRPVLRDHEGRVVARSAEGARTIKIRATPEQLQQVRAILEKYERGEGASCGLPPTGARLRD